jgi:hypothetical protein
LHQLIIQNPKDPFTLKALPWSKARSVNINSCMTEILSVIFWPGFLYNALLASICLHIRNLIFSQLIISPRNTLFHIQFPFPLLIRTMFLYSLLHTVAFGATAAALLQVPDRSPVPLSKKSSGFLSLPVSRVSRAPHQSGTNLSKKDAVSSLFPLKFPGDMLFGYMIGRRHFHIIAFDDRN